MCCILISFSVSLADLKHEFGHVPKLITAEKGEDIALSCFPPEGNPRPTIRWRRRGGPLLPLDTGKYSLDPSGVLLVRRLDPAEDAGQYECLVLNEEGTRVDSPVTLEVLDGPHKAGGHQAEEEKKEMVGEDFVGEEMVPTVLEAVLVDRVTGLVRWTPVGGAAAYQVLLMADEGQPVANISVEATVSQVKLHSLDPEVEYSVAVAAVTTGQQQFWSNFGPSRPLLAAATGRPTAILKEFTIHQAPMEADEPDGVPAHIWFLAVAVATLITVLLVLAAGIVFQRTAARRQSKDPALSGRETPGGGSSSCGSGRSYYYCSSGHSSWTERHWGGGGGCVGGLAAGREEPHFHTFKSDRRLLATDNHYDYVLQVPASAAEARDSAEAYQYFAHYASAPIIKPTAVKQKPTVAEYTLLMPLASPGGPVPV
jgi:hypothetical protein